MTTVSYNVYQQITSVRLASTSNLSGNYYNGQLNNGVGSNLTASSVGFLVIDGISAEVGDRILLKDQTNQNENGIYIVQSIGGPTSLWFMERSSDFQSVEQLKSGQFFSIGAGVTLAGGMYILVEPLPNIIGVDNINLVDVSSGGGGPYLTVAGNLSDLSNRETGFSNLGLGSGDELIIDESDFVAGLYTLSNPCPNLIFVNAENPGNAVRLPPVNESESFIPSQGPVFFIQSGFEGIDVQDSSGSVITSLVAPACEQFILTSNSVPNGVWFVRSFVSTVNGMSGDITISDLSPNLDEVYNSGADAEVNLVDNRPIVFNSVSAGIATSSVATPSTGTNTVANNRVLGWVFTSSSDITINSLQYDNSLFTGSGTRETGIYLKSTQELLGSVFISKTDPLVDGFRTATLNNPIQIQSGVEYVYATVVAAGEANHLNGDAVPAAGISITQSAILPSSGFPLPLSFPQSFTVENNTVFVGSFQYDTFTVNDSILFNDVSTSANSLLTMNSTTRGFRPPAMTTTQRDAIVSPLSGLNIYNTTTNTIDYFDGIAWQIGLTLDHLLAGTNITLTQNGDGTVTISSAGSGPGGNADYAGWAFSANATSNTFPAPSIYYPVIINAGSFSDIISSNFVNEVVSIGGRDTPCFRYIDNATQYFNVNINLNVKGAVAAQKQYIFQLAIQKADTSIFQTGFVSNVILQDLIFPYDISLSGIVQLSTGDRVFVYALNTTDTSSITLMYGNASIVNVDATQQIAMVWNNVTGTSASMVSQNGYVASNAGTVTLTLPTTCNFGAEIQVDGFGAGGWIIAQSAGQQCFYEGASTTLGVGGTISSTNSKACLTLRCVVANTTFLIESTTGSITLA